MGGHVFNTVKKIRKSNINPTLEKFKEQMINIFPNARQYFDKLITLGSVGKKPWSGDIDLAFDDRILYNLSDWDIDPLKYEDLYKLFKQRARTATDQQCQKRAIIKCIADKINLSTNTTLFASSKNCGSGMFSIEAPQWKNEGQLKCTVQIDLMFGNIDWLIFSYYSDIYKGNIKGLHRTQLLVHLFAYKGYSFSHNYGVKKDNKIVADTPDECINLLNIIYNIDLDRNILSNYFLLQHYLKVSSEIGNISKDDLKGVYDIYLKTLDSTRCDIPDDLQKYWINNQERLGLKGKFLPKESKLYQYKIDEDIK